MDFNKIPDACFDSADPSELRYEAMARLLLELFANQLSFFANEILIQQAEREPYRVRMARAYISNHQTEDFSLSDVARSIHISSFYLCKIFKKATGLTFIEFRNRLRIESAMKLLTNPNQSVSEIAYRVGFQSLAQFNRLFRRIIGQSPTTFRCSLKEACSPPSRNGVAVAIKGALPNSASRGNGAIARTVVPLSLDSISSSPPICRSRSRMPAMPKSTGTAGSGRLDPAPAGGHLLHRGFRAGQFSRRGAAGKPRDVAEAY